ncbi:MAG: hypothetical protein DMD72_14030 [Gemmatimonadetes bacterium]|nr:MAG: hypothetical protein DMD72_14030 [Gemmatimonadota bacterium]PYO79895.1 MAG: hypothetical protein DMD63_02885 [Gemmatimonadota bacterium]
MSVLVSTFCRRPMIRSRLLRSFALLAGAILMASCGSDSGAPDVTGPSDLGLSGPAIDAAGRQFDALWWKQDLTTVVQVSKTIDQSGGVLTIPETGLTIEFPAGALSGPITITVTADQKYVAYKMDPAGTQFLKDVTVTQSLANTTVSGQPLQSQLYATYIADDSLSLSGRVPVLEIEPSKTVFYPNSALPQAHVWIIRHFSRYMLASD